ncbi:MAG: ABC transporter permease [Casimicrobiaceae bacterium]
MRIGLDERMTGDPVPPRRVPGRVLRRLVRAFAAVLALLLATFGWLSLGGHPADLVVRPDLPAGERWRAIAALGLDAAPLGQFWHFLGGVAHALRGETSASAAPALGRAMTALRATLALVWPAAAVAVVAGLPLGLAAGLAARHPWARVLGAVAQIGASIPIFWLAALVFTAAAGLPGAAVAGTLPTACLAFVGVLAVTRRVGMTTRVDANQGYVGMARARGVPWSRIAMRHALPNVLGATAPAARIATDVATLLLLSTVVEAVFGRPGIGVLLIEALLARDRPVLVACMLLLAISLIVLRLGFDLVAIAVSARRAPA